MTFAIVKIKLAELPLQTTDVLEFNEVTGTGTTVTTTGDDVTGPHGALVTRIK